MLSQTSTMNTFRHSTQHMVRPEEHRPGSAHGPVHRRGLSAAAAGAPEGVLVGTNPGHFSQHFSQEAQQHFEARPGLEQIHKLQAFRSMQHQHLDAQIDSLIRSQMQPGNDLGQRMERSRSIPYEGDAFDASGPYAFAHRDQKRPTSSRSDTTGMGSSSRPPNWHSLVERRAMLGLESSTSAQYQDMDMNETIRPNRHSVQIPMSQFFEQPPSAGSSDTVVGPYGDALPSPPYTAPVKPTRHFDVGLVPGELAPMDLHARTPSVDSSSPYSSASPIKHESHGSADLQYRPSEVLFAGLNLDATIEETGISAEEVQSYISEADPVDGKWTCLFPECNKRFGRKENVRAHVQTHLGDRQYKCLHCSKCFVRQHDLKRHSKTHSGVKPYPCVCGASFARHDALTRHRQRNVCAGGMDGHVKKTGKRGRPKKIRDDDARVNKAAQSRKRAAARSYASSMSGSSESSSADSPESNYTDLDAQPHAFDLSSFSIHANLAASPPLSPVSTASPVRETAPTEETYDLRMLMDHRHDHASPPPSSHFGSTASSPPELSHSSPPASSRFLDLDMPSSFGGDLQEMASTSAGATSGDDSGFHPSSFSNSPNDLFDESPWKDDSLFNFEGSAQTSYGASKFTADFGDDLTFSGAAEADTQYF